jgi:3-hydroxybutyryl-CoA dehydrogenase
MLEIQTVAILGAGRDAVRVALLSSLAGLDVRLSDEEPDALDAALHELRHQVEGALADGRIGREERQRILDGILFTPLFDEAVVGADLVYASGAPDAAAARALLLRTARATRATTLLATAFDPAAVATALPQPGRVIGLVLDDADGFLPRVTIKPGPATTGHARARAAQFAERIDPYTSR